MARLARGSNPLGDPGMSYQSKKRKKSKTRKLKFFKEMIMGLSQEVNNDILILDWEDDVLGSRSLPNSDILGDFNQYINPKTFELELERHSKWAKKEAGLNQSEQELENDVKYQIACEVEEGRFLNQSFLNPGQFLLIPLENPERYDFFTVFCLSRRT